MANRILRVFPRRTKATPDDDLVVIGAGPNLLTPEVDAVHVSVTFNWDLAAAHALAEAWKGVASVTIGGPALGEPSGEFTPGLYLKQGYVITSRGCPAKRDDKGHVLCWFCNAWKREGALRELVIHEGYNILDDNFLACSTPHKLRVIDMLRLQKMGRPEFTGGLQAERFTLEDAEMIRSVRPKQIFFAYDSEHDWEPLVRAAVLCWRVGFTKRAHRVRAYVLCGYAGDTLEDAESRMARVQGLGIVPMAMVYRNASGAAATGWKGFQRRWARPAIACA